MFTILVADDEVDLLPILEMTIKEAFPNSTVICVDSGKKALDALHRVAVDFVLTDLIMPGVNGFELIKTLTKIGIPYVALTGLTCDGRYSKSEREILNSSLRKPQDINKINDSVARGLSSQTAIAA